MLLIELTLRGFRNLLPLDLAVSAGMTAVVGANGAGKTNLLEAIAVLGNLASFRPGPPGNWVARGESTFVLAGTVTKGQSTIEIRQTARFHQVFSRSLYRGARRVNAAEYLELFPVTTLSTLDRELITGGPEHRSRFLDRLAFHLHPETLLVLQRYGRALRQRNVLLVTGGSDDQLAAFEHDLAHLGGRLVALRLEALRGMESALERELAALGWLLPRLNLRYHAPDGEAGADAVATARNLVGSLARGRRAERTRGHTLIGPHRHDLRFMVQGAPARDILSAGQGKLLATALKLSAMAILERARGGGTMVVFDDLDAELDAQTLARVYERLKGSAQVLVSSAQAETLLPRLDVVEVWRMNGGVLTASRPGGSRG